MLDDSLFVDIHCHLAPPKRGIYGVLGQTPEQLIERMDENGVDYTVVFSMVNTAGLSPEGVKAANDYIIEAIGRYPERLLGFCLTTPRHGDDCLAEIRRCVDAGMRGIKLHPHLLGYYPVDGEVMNPLMEAAEALALPVLIHSDINSKRCNPYQVVRLAQRFPNVPVIMAHWGMDSDFVHFVPDLVKGVRNVYLDTSCTPNLPEAIFSKPSYSIPDQLLFGSDGPTLSIEVEICKLRVAEQRYGMDPNGKRGLLGENAARLLGLTR